MRQNSGFELEAFTRPMRDLAINAGVTYVEHPLSRQSGRRRRQAAVQRAVPAAGPPDLERAEMDGHGSVAWTPPIGGSGMRGLIYADVRYMSKFNTGSDLDIEKMQKAFTVVNGRIGVHGPDDRWAIEVWAQNLFDKNYTQVAFDAPIQGSGRLRAASRRASSALDADLRRLPRRAADVRRDSARQARLRPAGAAALCRRRRAAAAAAGGRAAGAAATAASAAAAASGRARRARLTSTRAVPAERLLAFARRPRARGSRAASSSARAAPRCRQASSFARRACVR